MTTRREFLELAALGVAAAVPGVTRGSALEAKSGRTRGRLPPAIVDWHAHWIAPHVVELLSARTSPRPRRVRAGSTSRRA